MCKVLWRRASLAFSVSVFLAACSSGIQGISPDVGDSDLSSLATALSYKVPDVASDAEEYDSTVYTTSPVLELGYKTPDTPQLTGVRFSSVAVPKGATIDSAYLEFTAVTDKSEATTLTIYGNDVDNGSVFGSGVNSISQRIKTTAKATWSPGAWTDGQIYRSPNISSIVKEITGRSGWTSKNSMAFMISGTGLRKAHAFDAGNNLQPLLRITYTVPASNNSCLTSPNPQTYPESQKLIIENLSAGGQVSLIGKTYDNEPSVTIRNNGDNLCISGGTLKTDAVDNSSWENVFHGGGRLFLNIYNSKNVTADRLAGYIAGDGLHIESNLSTLNGSLHSENWKLTNSYFRHVGDDIVDNDMRAAGTIDNVLVDWAYTGIACRGHAQGFQRAPGAISVKNTLFAIKPQASGAGGTNLYYSPFKWDTQAWDDYDPPVPEQFRTLCPLALNNVTIYMAPTPTGAEERSIFATFGGGSSTDPVEFVTECQNVTFLYGGTNYGGLGQLAALKAKFSGKNCFNVIQGTDARAAWNTQRAAWFDRNNGPGFEHIQTYRNSQPLEP